MSTSARFPIAPLSEWVRRTDVHAAVRLSLLANALRVLDGEEPSSQLERNELADRLERWRYQWLNQQHGRLTPEDRRWLDCLDLMANELAGRGDRPPRRTRQLIHDDGLAGPEIAEAWQHLDPARPLAPLVERARALTIERFGEPATRDPRPASGRRMLLYAPLYLSSHCINYCTYCGFRYPRDILRRHLSFDEAKSEANVLLKRGFRHILLVGGEFPRLTTTEYYAQVIEWLLREGVAPAVEIAPQSTCHYARLAEAGACCVTLYQETYDETLYAEYHPKGSKASYDWRFEGLDRAADGAVGRLGLGILLGLADPVEDTRAMMRHAAYLQARHPDRTIAFSLPRIHEAPQGFRAPYRIDDDLFVRLYCVLRLGFPDAELVLSTRENAALRDRLADICITQMSAGSCTAPGGYEHRKGSGSGEQFPVSDHRSAGEMAAWLTSRGYRVAWQIGAR